MPKVWTFGDNVDTDQILPGRYAPYMTSEEEFFHYAFHEYRPEFAKKVAPGDIIVAGKNFGCGSSREYAPRALKKCGIMAVIADGFARIFFRNALNLGILLFEAKGLNEVLTEGQEVALDPVKGELQAGGKVYQLRQPPRFVHEIIKEGTIIDYFRRYKRFPGEAP